MILGAVAAQTGLPGKSIGRIDLGDKASYFEVPLEDVKTVINTMDNCRIKGMPVKTELLTK